MIGAPPSRSGVAHATVAVDTDVASTARLRGGSATFIFWTTASAVFDAPAEALCFLREHEGRTLLAAFNFGATPVTVTLPAGAAVTPLAGHGFDPCMPAGGRVTLPAAGAFFANLAPGGSTRS